MPSKPPAPRPVLRPGMHVVRRDDRHLQVGLEPPQAVVLPDSPATRRFLEALRVGEAPVLAGPEQVRVVGLLAQRDLLVDAAHRDDVLRGATDRSAAAGLLAAAGDDACTLVVSRAATRVAVDAPADLRAGLVRLLLAAGLEVSTGREEAHLVMVLSDTVLPRRALDPLVRDGRPHLVVEPRADGLEVGPLVLPGVTACLRCVDAHRAEADPRRAVVLEQCVEANRATGPVPRDPALLAAATGLAAAEVVSWADGRRPSTWSGSLVLRPGAAPEHRRWRRHPHCGCAWDQLAG